MKYGGLRRFSFKWWLALPFSIGDIWKRLTPRDPQVHAMSYWWNGTLERKAYQNVFKKCADAAYSLVNSGRRDPTTSTTLFELNCILMAMREVDAKKVLEIGTFDGNTTVNIAANLPEGGEVVTVDLPVEETTEYSIAIDDPSKRNVTDRKIVGAQFKAHPAGKRVRQVFGDTAKLDWKAFGGPFDMIFIDGCHAYEYVKSDTEKALSVVRPGGIVLWHDYAEMDSVSNAVDEFRDRFQSLCALAQTRIAVGFVKG